MLCLLKPFFENLYCLLPGHYLWYKNGKITTTRYWEAMFEPQNDMTEAQAVDKIEKSICEFCGYS